jgi:sugar/nucleoside kinase (ribokinase family)
VAADDPRVLIVGGMSIDTITQADGTTHLSVLGGNAVFAAVGAMIWDVSTTVVGLVGDGYPRAWIDELRGAGIGTDDLQFTDRPHETYFAVRYREDGDREPHVPTDAFARAGLPVPAPLRRMSRLLGEPGVGGWRANDETRTAEWRTDPGGLSLTAWDVAAVLVVPASLDRQQGWVDASAGHVPPGCPILLDPEEEQGRTLTLDDLRPLLANIRVVMPSLRQIAGLMTSDDVGLAARRLADLGPAIVAIKLGAEGCYVYEAATDRGWHIPAYATTVVDVTGAGDAFCGGFMSGYIRTGDPFEAGLRGVVSASFAVEGVGALHGLHHGRSQAERRLRHWRKEVPGSVEAGSATWTT